MRRGIWPIGLMLWRIGDLLDWDAQLNWALQAGFGSAGFHASPGLPGHWRGIDPAAVGPAERQRLRRRLAPLAWREVHAPFAAEVTPEAAWPAVAQLGPVIAFAGEVGADVVTVHAQAPAAPGPGREDWLAAIAHLAELAGQAGVTIGLELSSGFACLPEIAHPRLGITLDIGHVSLDGGAGYRPYGSIGNLVRALGERLVHLHVHDYDGTHDHIELGSGQIDIDDVLRGLADIGYRGGLCLELNPERVSPEAMQRSREWLQGRM